MSCNNCKGSITQQGSLPPGCTAIQNIETTSNETTVVVTITLCDGNITQFSIPIPEDGAPGSPGSPGNNGTSVTNVVGVQNGNNVTLTFTLSDNSTFDYTFILPTDTGNTFVIEHQKNTEAPIYEDEIILPNTSLWESLVPSNTLLQAGDTLLFDVLYLLNRIGGAGGSIENFKIHYGNTLIGRISPTIVNKDTLFRLQGKITLIGSQSGSILLSSGNFYDFVGEITYYNAANVNISESNPQEGNSDMLVSSAPPLVFYKLPFVGPEINEDNVLKITGNTLNRVNARRLYSLTKRIPKI
jgi:hypothetical protein